MGEGPCTFQLEGRQYDLTRLDSIYHVPGDQYLYHFNPCTILSGDATNCPEEHYCCQEEFILGQNLYYSVTTQYSKAELENFGNGIAVSYIVGDYCPGFGAFRSMTIHYICGPNLNAPTFRSESRCHYEFDWVTSAVCDENPEPASCKFTFAGKNYDFTRLDQTWELFGEDIYNYYLNPCSALNMTRPPAACKGSQGCQSLSLDTGSGYSIGKALTEIFPGLGAPSSTLIFRITGGDVCPRYGISRTTEISFGCGQDLGIPQFVSESNCFYRFKWLTNLAC